MSTTTAPKRVTARPTTTNVLKTFWRATPAEFEEGREWYFRARTLAFELARTRKDYCIETMDREVSKAIAVIAVLSPQLSWDRNVDLAWLAYSRYDDAVRRGATWLKDRDQRLEAMLTSWPGLKTNGRKAMRILDGERPEDVVSGPKVTAFYYAIKDANDPRGIVIDRHAFDVAVGRVMDDRTRGIVLGRAGAYESFVRAYERATVGLRAFYPNITPAEVQAVTWVVWRNEKKAGFH